MDELSDLPVFKAFNEIKCAFINSGNLVLQSPTGSGKSIGLPFRTVLFAVYHLERNEVINEKTCQQREQH